MLALARRGAREQNGNIRVHVVSMDARDPR